MKPVTAFLGLLLCATTAACMPNPPSASVATATSASSFATMAAASNQFEIETSRIALERSSDPGVRRFASRMIADHTTASRRMAAIASREGLALPPPMLDARHAAMVQTLSATPEASFDQAYVSMQAAAHQEAVSLFSAYASQGDNPALRTFAKQTLPTLEMHAQMVARLGTPTAGM